MPQVEATPGRKLDYVCKSCGYGIAVTTSPPECPMCRGSEWDEAAWRPFTSLDEYRNRFEPAEAEPQAIEALVI